MDLGERIFLKNAYLRNRMHSGFDNNMKDIIKINVSVSLESNLLNNLHHNLYINLRDGSYKSIWT